MVLYNLRKLNLFSDIINNLGYMYKVNSVCFKQVEFFFFVFSKKFIIKLILMFFYLSKVQCYYLGVYRNEEDSIYIFLSILYFNLSLRLFNIYIEFYYL